MGLFIHSSCCFSSLGFGFLPNPPFLKPKILTLVIGIRFELAQKGLTWVKSLLYLYVMKSKETKIQKPKSPQGSLYYRIQPPNKNLDWNSITSEDNKIGGIFVFEEKPTREYIEVEWLPEYYEEQELVVIEANSEDVFDCGDYEGVIIPRGKGKIIERIPWNKRIRWFSKSKSPQGQ